RGRARVDSLPRRRQGLGSLGGLQSSRREATIAAHDALLLGENNMLKPTVLTAGALVLLATAGLGRAQQFANVTPDMIRTSLPVEGAPLAEKGAYEVTSEPAFGAPGHVVVRPSQLD